MTAFGVILNFLNSPALSALEKIFSPQHFYGGRPLGPRYQQLRCDLSRYRADSLVESNVIYSIRERPISSLVYALQNIYLAELDWSRLAATA